MGPHSRDAFSHLPPSPPPLITGPPLTVPSYPTQVVDRARYAPTDLSLEREIQVLTVVRALLAGSRGGGRGGALLMPLGCGPVSPPPHVFLASLLSGGPRQLHRPPGVLHHAPPRVHRDGAGARRRAAGPRPQKGQLHRAVRGGRAGRRAQCRGGGGGMDADVYAPGRGRACSYSDCVGRPAALDGCAWADEVTSAPSHPHAGTRPPFSNKSWGASPTCTPRGSCTAT